MNVSSATVPSLGAIRDLVEALRDPELHDVTLGDLGLIGEITVEPASGREGPSDAERWSVVVELLPTFLGCPALDLLQQDIVSVLTTFGAQSVIVPIICTPVWTPQSISERGRSRLALLGVAVPNANGESNCTRCQSPNLVHVVSVGASACRSLGRCESCGELVESMRGPADNRPGVAVSWIPRRLVP